MRICLVLLGLLLALPIATGCSKRKVGKSSLAEVERLPRVETIVLGKPERIEVVRSYTATVEPYEEADLCAMVKGYLRARPAEVDIGRRVKKDELLLTLEVPDLIAERDNKTALVNQSEKEEARAVQAVDVAEAEVKEAQSLLQRYEAEWEFRKLQFTRVSRLAQADTLSQQQEDEAKLQVGAARAALSAAQAQVLTKQARFQAAQKERQVAASRVVVARAELQKSQVQVDFANLRAPFDGVITKRWVDSGATIKDANMPLLKMMRTDMVRVLMDVPERDAPYFRVGEQANAVELRVPALQEIAGTEKIAGSVTLTAAALDPVTRTMRTEMHLQNKVGDKVGLLRPQMSGTALVTLAVREALTVPASALVRVGTKMEIYIVADTTGEPPRGTVKRVEVQIGIDDGRRVEIRNETLTGRELIIAKGAGSLRPGDQVIAVMPHVVE